MSTLAIVLIVILFIFLLGGFHPRWGGPGYGYGAPIPTILIIIIVIVLVLAMTGRL